MKANTDWRLQLINGFKIISLQGKFIRINFDVTGFIVGANVETCILDDLYKPNTDQSHILN